MPHISDTQHLPPLKSKLIGGPGTLFNGVGSTHALNQQSDNCDSMSINGSIVSNGSGVTSTSGVTNGVATATMANGHAVNGVHVNGMATLPLVRPATGGDTSRNSTLESPKHGDPNGTQNGECRCNSHDYSVPCPRKVGRPPPNQVFFDPIPLQA